MSLHNFKFSITAACILGILWKTSHPRKITTKYLDALKIVACKDSVKEIQYITMAQAVSVQVAQCICAVLL